MRWSITLGTFWGTAVRIHITFLLLLAWIGFVGYQRAGVETARDSVLFILLIFTCVVLHEFGHILAARRYGIVASEITLLPIGGVANIDKMPEKPHQELLIAIAGPLVNVVIALSLVLLLGAIDVAAIAHVEDPKIGLVQRLIAANVFLAVFNMIPAFPMDGGRVLRAVLSMWIGRARATRIASQIGQLFAFALGFLGLFGSPLLVFIAIFIYIAAAGEAQMTIVSEMTRDITVADAMETKIAMIDREASVAEAVKILLTTSQEDFPLVDRSGRFSGLLSRTDLVAALRESDASDPVAPYARERTATIDAFSSLGEALEKLNAVRAVVVIGEGGVLLGLVTHQSIADVVLIKTARPDWRFQQMNAGR